MEYRPYGNTGVTLSVIGMGGIVVAGTEQDCANRIVAEAVERGVTYFDVAPSYGDAEVKLGPALEPYRDKVFLASKTGERGGQAAKAEFERSVEHLRTDHFDLYQLHALWSLEKDVDAAFATGGVMEFLLERKAAGQIRFLGFSAHDTAAALAALDRYEFDSVLFPLNFAAFYRGAFGPDILERATDRGAARLALKAMARQRYTDHPPSDRPFLKCWYEPLSDPNEASLALRWALNQPITAALPPGEETLFRLALDIAEDGLTLSDEERDAVRAMAEGLTPVFPIS